MKKCHAEAEIVSFLFKGPELEPMNGNQMKAYFNLTVSKNYQQNKLLGVFALGSDKFLPSD